MRCAHGCVVSLFEEELLGPTDGDAGADGYHKRFSGGLDSARSPQASELLAIAQRPPALELFDLQNDPFEFVNVAARSQFAGVLHELRRRLLQFRQTTAEPVLARGLDTFLERSDYDEEYPSCGRATLLKTNDEKTK